MEQKINRLFPVNEAGNIQALENEEKKNSIKADINNLFSKLAPYFLVLQQYMNNDVEAEKYARKVLLEKPRDMLEKLLGLHEQGKYYTDPTFSPTILMIFILFLRISTRMSLSRNWIKKIGRNVKRYLKPSWKPNITLIKKS